MRAYHFLILAGLALAGCERPQVVLPGVSPLPAVPEPLAPIVALPPAPLLGERGHQLILDYEVGGGRPYYEKKLAHPTVPPGESGVTIGVGYDLRFNTERALRGDWRKLDGGYLNRLAKATQLNHAQSQAILPQLRDILIRWDLAEEVFSEVTVTRFYQLARRTFPGMEDLRLDAQAVLVSLCFNRGSSMGVPDRPSWDSRREMRAIRDLVPKRDYAGMSAQIRKMKRLWVGKGMDGLLARREAEARLMEGAR